jgi:Ni/Fe-hydrogenase subunit HybB-like protein
MHREKYETIIRPALLTAMLGYTFVASSVLIDIGRWYSIWHPLVFWNGTSALFEVGICVMIYLTVLYIEFLPIVCERFMGKVNLPGLLKSFNKPIDNLLRLLDRTLSKTMFFIYYCRCSSLMSSSIIIGNFNDNCRTKNASVVANSYFTHVVFCFLQFP